MVCDYGCGRVGLFVLKNGRTCCSKSTNSCSAVRQRNSDRVKILYQTGERLPPMLGRQPWNKGVSYDAIVGSERAAEIKLLQSINHAGGSVTSSPDVELERRAKLSRHAKLHNYGGYKRGSGRGRKGWYCGYWCDSSWELAFVIHRLENGIAFSRNLERFEYLYEGVKRQWIPDFIQGNTYVEIKGYLSPQAEAKIKLFDRPLLVLTKEHPGLVEVLRYVIDKYGKRFTQLYEHGVCSSIG